MRLLKIILSNFGYYGDETIDLSNIAACTVIGQNGTGKSTGLVDAPLWAFFEQCRGKTDEMMKPGEQEMSVQVVWTQDSQTYHVIRKRSKRTKAGKSELALHVKDGDEWVPISGASIAETQEQIERLLGLDYDLLTKTAFLLQGQADAFSKARPTERKAILASILRLDRYAALKTRANAETNRLAAQCETAVRDRDVATALVATIPDLQQHLASIQQCVAAFESDLSTLTTRRHDLMARKATLDAQLAHAETDRLRVSEVQQQVQEIDRRIAQLTQSRTAHETVLAEAPEIRSAFEETEKVERRWQDIDQQIRTDLEPQLTTLAEKIAAVDADRQAVQDIQVRYQTAKGKLDLLVQQYQSDTTRLTKDIERDQQAVQLLDKVPCGPDLQQRCQFTLNAAKIQQALPANVAALAERPRDGGAIAMCMAGDLLQAVNQLDDDRLARTASIDQSAYQDMVTLRTTLNTQRDECRREQARLQTVLTHSKQMAARLSSVELAEQLLPGLDADLETKQYERDRLQAELTTIQDRLRSAESLALTIHQLAAELPGLDTTEQALRQQVNAKLIEQGLVQEKLSRAELAHPEAAHLTVLVQDIERDLRHYKALAEAYALIPVLVMESSLPVLEREVNQILSTISSTGLRVRIETQKTLVSRDGLAETLDIIASDAKGERRYEIFSGGEKFRLDLAIRVGLSKLLANRAGAKVETLVIDEGLGSLDQDGLTQLRECLSALGSEFKVVIVITHVEAMKSTFPSQIFVTADADGSHVQVFA